MVQEIQTNIALSAQRVKQVREDHRMTQKQLADILGVTHSAVSKWEKGSSIINTLSAYKLAVFMGINQAWILGLSNDIHISHMSKPKESEVSSDISSLYKQLKPEDKLLVENLIKRLLNYVC